uniref:Uncharacterized protein n=1 Tax=Angiostrongylus cantonensis TaxID=6313 RepID=A0A0K0DA54_ANGCA
MDCANDGVPMTGPQASAAEDDGDDDDDEITKMSHPRERENGFLTIYEICNEKKLDRVDSGINSALESLTETTRYSRQCFRNILAPNP